MNHSSFSILLLSGKILKTVVNMPRQEFGIQAGAARFKFIEIVNTSNGVYMIFPIPEMCMHLSLHYPNETHNSFGAFLRVPGLKLSYTLELDEDILTLNNLLKVYDCFSASVERGYNVLLDDSEVVIVPESFLASFMGSGRKNYFDVSNLMLGGWNVSEAERLPDMVTKSSPTVVGISLDEKNTAIIVDHDEGTFKISFDELIKEIYLDSFWNSFQTSIKDAFEQIEIRRPDVLAKATPTDLINELQKLFHAMQSGLHNSRTGIIRRY